MDNMLIVLAIILLLAITSLIFFWFKSLNKKKFRADDGSLFDNQSDLDIYQNLYLKTKTLFLSDSQMSSKTTILGFDKSFLIKLTNEGFPDLKSLFIYRKQIKSLSDLINT